MPADQVRFIIALVRQPRTGTVLSCSRDSQPGSVCLSSQHEGTVSRSFCQPYDSNAIISEMSLISAITAECELLFTSSDVQGASE